jgi:hypothetical protein
MESKWDFQTALGDTIREKYESLYVKVVEVSNVINRKMVRGQANWVVTSPEVASMFFETVDVVADQKKKKYRSIDDPWESYE